MSHNLLTINDAKPAVTGVVSVALSDLLDVSATVPRADQFLAFDGSKWAPSFLLYQTIFVGEGAAQDYSTSTATSTAAGAIVEFYQPSPLNGISGATVTSTDGWVSSVTLTTGRYIVEAVVALSFSSSVGSAVYQIFKDGVGVGSRGSVGFDALRVGARARAVVNVTTESVITVRLESAGSINGVASQGTRQAQRGSFEVRRV